MSGYQWRKLSDAQRAETLRHRRLMHWPMHSPPHLTRPGVTRQLVTGACYEHADYIGYSLDRMTTFVNDLRDALLDCCRETYAYCVLPNHYHALIATTDLDQLFLELGKLHGRCSHRWNGEENMRGRKVFFRATNRFMRNNRHFWATLNYIHHNPVHHGHVTKWQDWPWSSAADFLKQAGEPECRRLWKEYPILDYGQGWDQP
jgi:putative transposase